MTPEDYQRMQQAMQFIVEQQAELTTKIDRMAEAQLNAEARVTRLEQGFEILVRSCAESRRKIGRAASGAGRVKDRATRNGRRVAVTECDGRALHHDAR